MTRSLHPDVTAIRAWLGSGALNLFGSPFAGKDTQVARLARYLGAPTVGGGQILRDLHATGRLDEVVWQAYTAGDLIPSEPYQRIIEVCLRERSEAGRPLVLSAVGRMQGEQEATMAALTAVGHSLAAVIELTISPATAESRWREAQQRGDRGHRDDDTRAALQHRLQVYQAQTLPVLEFYRHRGLVVTIDGTGTPDEVELAIQIALQARASL